MKNEEESIPKLCFDSAFVSFNTFVEIFEKTKSERTKEQNKFLEDMVTETRGSFFKMDAFFEDGKMIRTEDDWVDDHNESLSRN